MFVAIALVDRRFFAIALADGRRHVDIAIDIDIDIDRYADVHRIAMVHGTITVARYDIVLSRREPPSRGHHRGNEGYDRTPFKIRLNSVRNRRLIEMDARIQAVARAAIDVDDR